MDVFSLLYFCWYEAWMLIQMSRLYTIGHSTHSVEEFEGLLQKYEITHLIDVRSVPKSRHVPWFNTDPLKKALSKLGIDYLHFPELGGLRKAQKHSINEGWENLSFRGYADYMQTPEFYTALKTLNQMLTKDRKVVIMCAEAVPWRCHRSLIADAEVIRGIKVFHIMSKTQIHEHELTGFAVVNRKKRPIEITYPFG